MFRLAEMLEVGSRFAGKIAVYIFSWLWFLVAGIGCRDVGRCSAALPVKAGPEVPVSVLHLRGQALRTMARSEGSGFSQRTDALRVRAIPFPGSIATGHFACVGATGSGKTMLRGC